MIQGIHRYPPMDRVIYGIPLAQALADEVSRLDARAVYVMASGTLNRETDVIDTVRRVLGNRLAGVCAKIGAHTPRTDVVAAANEARAAKADLIVTVGGGSVTDAAKMVGLCLGNDVTAPEDLDRLRATVTPDGKTRAPAGQAARGALDRRADDPVGRGVHPVCRLHRHGAACEGKLRPSADDAAGGDPRSGGHRPHAGMAVPVDRNPSGGSCGGGYSARSIRRRSPMACRCRRYDCCPPACPRSKRAPSDLDARLNCQLGCLDVDHGRA